MSRAHHRSLVGRAVIVAIASAVTLGCATKPSPREVPRREPAPVERSGPANEQAQDASPSQDASPRPDASPLPDTTIATSVPTEPPFQRAPSTRAHCDGCRVLRSAKIPAVSKKWILAASVLVWSTESDLPNAPGVRPNHHHVLRIETPAGAFERTIGWSGEGGSWNGAAMFHVSFVVDGLSVERNRVHLRACESTPCRDEVFEIDEKTLVPGATHDP